MRACVIIHNMIVEDERDSYSTNFDYSDEEVNINVSRPQIRRS
jgi:Plant transposon protein